MTRTCIFPTDNSVYYYIMYKYNHYVARSECTLRCRRVSHSVAPTAPQHERPQELQNCPSRIHPPPGYLLPLQDTSPSRIPPPPGYRCK